MSDIQQRQNFYSKIRGAAGPAFEEAEKSGLPGTHNGPGDAYRHMIGTTEKRENPG